MHHRSTLAPLTLATLVAIALSACGQPAGGRRADPSAAPPRPGASSPAQEAAAPTAAPAVDGPSSFEDLPAAASSDAPAAGVEPLDLTGHIWRVNKERALAWMPKVLEEMSGEAPEAPADPVAPERIADDWVSFEIDAAVAEGLSQPEAARRLMYLSVAMNDALLIARAAREEGLEVSDQAALALAANAVSIYLHDGRRRDPAEFFAQIWSGYWRGEESATAVINGIALGIGVGYEIQLLGMEDRSDQAATTRLTPSANPGRWTPGASPADLPGWGNVQVSAVYGVPRPRPPAPPAWDSPEMEAQRREFAAIALREPTDAERSVSAIWLELPGSPTAAVIWMGQASRLAAEHSLDEHESAALFAAVGIALHDGAVVAYESQYHYLVERPESWMRDEHPDWGKLVPATNRPSYPSATAVMSGAARSVLVARFPDEAAPLSGLAADAARAGLLAGAEWPQDGQAGLELGNEVFVLIYLRLAEARWPESTMERP